MIVQLGDTHNYSLIINHAKAIGLSDCDLIQVGDFGLGMKANDFERLRELNDFLVSNNIILHVIRGNHDDPNFFKGNYRFVFSNIDLIPDYTVKKIQKKNILFVGGAISIDRLPNPKIADFKSPTGKWLGRKEGVDYWKDEAFVFDEEKIRSIRGIDTVITHTAPSFVEPFLKTSALQWFDTDPTLEEELFKERSLMSDMCFILKQNNNITKWSHGHYHYPHQMDVDNIRFRLLAEMEFAELY